MNTPTLSLHGLYALRTELLLGRDASRRALAADRLGQHRDPRSIAWLLDALDDPSPLVRSAAFRALARCAPRGDSHAFDLSLARAGTEPVWWVRRTALLAAAALGTPERAALGLSGLLDDPFWRVRYAAVYVLLALTTHDPSLIPRVLAKIPPGSVAQAAADFLRAHWEGTTLSSQTFEASSARPDDGLYSPDPAVVNARLSSRSPSEISPLSLVEYLADPHPPLRRFCLRELVLRADFETLCAACYWLEHPRLAHGPDTVRALLERVADRAEPVALWALRPEGPPGARRWAVAWALRHGSTSLRDLAESAGEPEAHPDSALSIALARADLSALRTALHEGDFAMRPRCIEALCSLHALRDPERQELLGDPDPWVRTAALDLDAATALVNTDPDREVCRAAMRLILRARKSLPQEALSQIARAASGSRDSKLRASACELFSLDHDLSGLLAASHDVSPEVRYRAARRLERAADLDARIEQLLGAGALEAHALRGAYTWLLRAFDGEARALLLRALDAPASPPELRAHLRAMSFAFEDPVSLPASSPDPVVSCGSPAAAGPSRELVARRAIGPISARPLAISGVFELGARAYARAHARGVELFFWEPRYRELTRFLRARDTRARVIAGSYEGSPAAIERDVIHGLRRLGRETLDVFLLFWVRAPERLSDEALSCLLRLKREGKLGAVGFSTHHRDIARSALLAQPWDLVMVRHSAAHPGAEESLLPAALARGVGVLTFSALTYGRMLRVPPGFDRGAYPEIPSAVDCYRYSTSQPGVGACIAAPRSLAELHHDLALLDRDTLDPQSLGALRAQGARVREASRRFNTFVRRAQGPGLHPGQSAALELMEHSEGESEVA